jgi:Uncharacterized conserved protein
MNLYKDPSEIPSSIKDNLDTIVVLGGGVPETVSDPPVYTKARCKAAAQVYKSVNTNERLKILALSAGTAHVPQLISFDGLPVWESTASASYLMKELGVPPEDIYVETTSYDTISNAFFTRTNFCDINDWKKLLIVTNEFHMKRTMYIFNWIMNAENPREKQTDRRYELYFLSVPDDGLSEVSLRARYDKEEKSARNVKDVLSKKFPTLPDIFGFLNHEHSFYTAKMLVDRANNDQIKDESPGAMILRQSYGGTSSNIGKHKNNWANTSMEGENAFFIGVLFGISLAIAGRLLLTKGHKMHIK